MMRIAVLGATGGTGRIFCDQALAAGHEVSALVRNPIAARLPGRIAMVEGSIADPDSLRALLLKQDVVVSCLGAPLMKSMGPEGTVGSEGMRVILPLMKEAGVGRLIVVSALGAGDSQGMMNIGFRLVMATVLRGVYRDKNRMESIVRPSRIDWTLVRPSNLTNGPYTGSVDVAPLTKLGLTSRISRADVAGFLLRILGDASTYRQAVLITSR